MIHYIVISAIYQLLVRRKFIAYKIVIEIALRLDFTMAAAESGTESDGSWDDFPAENPVRAAVLKREIAAVAGKA